MVESLDRLYGEIILDHHQDPRGFGKLEHADAHEEGFNPLCGDRVEVGIKLGAATESGGEKVVKQVMFTGEGCSICLASASMMTEEVEGLSVSKTRERIELFRKLMQGEVGTEVFEGDIVALAGVQKFPVRIKCALLPWMTLKKGVEAVCPAMTPDSNP